MEYIEISLLLNNAKHNTNILYSKRSLHICVRTITSPNIKKKFLCSHGINRYLSEISA